MQRSSRLINILSTIVAICLVTILPHLGLIPLPFGYVVPVLLFIFLYLKFRKETIVGNGFRWSDFRFHAVVIGTITGVVLFFFLNHLFFPLLKQLVPLPPADISFAQQLKGNTGFYLFLLLMGWLVGGFYEEFVFHGFMFTQLEKILPARKVIVMSVLLTNLVFALYHFQLGYEGVLNAFLAGMVYHLLILRFKRNLWYGIICHAVFDTVALTMLYLGFT